MPKPKKREDVAKLSALRLEALYDRKPFGKRHVLVPNGALSWDGFNRIWCKGAEYYTHPDYEHPELPSGEDP